MKTMLKLLTAILIMTSSLELIANQTMNNSGKNDWDKTFPKSDKVKIEKASFRNRYGISLAADVYIP